MQRITSQLNTAMSLGAGSEAADALFEQRKQLLYPAELCQSSFKKIDLGRSTRNDPKVVALRQQLLAGKSAQAVWQQHADAGERDILRAMLLLLDEPDLKSELARPLLRSPLQQARSTPGLTDPGMVAVIKQYPYFPTGWQEQGKPATPRNLNEEAQFPSSDDGKISCRHLAIEHVQRMARDTAAIKCDLHAVFPDVAAIEANIGRQTEAQYAALVAHASETHLVSNARFGQFLADQFAAMQRSGNITTKVMLLDSTNHSMSLGLRIKVNHGKPVYVVKLFDPNRTTHHVRSSTGNLATFATHDLADWLDGEAARHCYYPEASPVSVMFVHDARDGIGADADNIPEPGRTLTSFQCVLDETAMHHLVRNGFSGNLQQIESQFASLPDARKIALLHATNGIGNTGLFYAMTSGHAATLPAFASLLAHVPAENRADILGAVIHGNSALDGAVLTKQVAVIRAFGEVLALVPEAQRADLLKAPGHGKCPALNLAMDCPDGDVLRAFSEALGTVPPEARAEVLAARSADGTPGLHHAMSDGNADTVTAFGTLLALVPEHQRADLLAATDVDGMPALGNALLGDDVDTVRAFGTLLPLIPARERAGLLWAETPDGVTGQDLAEGSDHPDMQATYQHLLLQFSPQP